MKLKTSVDFMPRVTEDFLLKVKSIHQACSSANTATTPVEVQEAYKVTKKALDEINVIIATHTLVGLKPYLENLTNEPDWSVYTSEYNALINTDVPAFLTAVESNVSQFSVASINNEVVWEPFTAGQTTALKTLLGNILSHFE